MQLDLEGEFLARPSLPGTVCAYLILGALTYLVGVREGYFEPVQLPFPTVTASIPGQ